MVHCATASRKIVESWAFGSLASFLRSILVGQQTVGSPGDRGCGDFDVGLVVNDDSLLSATGHVSDGIQGHSWWAGKRRNLGCDAYNLGCGNRPKAASPGQHSGTPAPRGEPQHRGVHAGQDVAVKVQMFDSRAPVGPLHGHVVDVKPGGGRSRGCGGRRMRRTRRCRFAETPRGLCA